MRVPYYPSVLSVEEAGLELARLGQLLDAADCRQIPLSAVLYRQAACRMRLLLQEHMGVPDIRAICSEYVSLQETLANLTFECERTAGLHARSDITPFKVTRS